LNSAPFTTKAAFEGAGVIIGFLVVIPALHLSWIRFSDAREL